MREHLGFETDEICRNSASRRPIAGCLLYRARMALRLCLEQTGSADDALVQGGFAPGVPGSRSPARLRRAPAAARALAICDGCTNFKKQVEFLRKAVKQLG